MLSTRVPTAFIIFCAFGLAQRGSPAQSPGTGEVLMAAACSWRTSASFARPQSLRHHCRQDRPRSEMSTPTFRTVFAASVLLGCVAIG